MELEKGKVYLIFQFGEWVEGTYTSTHRVRIDPFPCHFFRLLEPKKFNMHEGYPPKMAYHGSVDIRFTEERVREIE